MIRASSATANDELRRRAFAQQYDEFCTGGALDATDCLVRKAEFSRSARSGLIFRKCKTRSVLHASKKKNLGKRRVKSRAKVQN
jgi:hypothetical protein